MFSNLRQVFIVKKPDTLKIATVSNISTPYYLPNHTMDISVKYDGETVESYLVKQVQLIMIMVL